MIELLVALLLIALNGVFALSELAIVSARRTRLKTMVEDGVRGASTALALSENPGRFLSTVQIGITAGRYLVGQIISGAALGKIVGDWLLVQGMPIRFAPIVGYGLVISGIAYLWW